MIISPSLLAFDFLNLDSQIQSFNKISNLWYHLDVMDGHFVPNLSFGTPLIQAISKVATHPLDVHLMVKNPGLHLEMYKSFNIHNFTFHWEAISNHSEFIGKVKKYYPSVGLSIKPKTLIKDLPLSILEQLNVVLVMSIEPGFGGQKFQESSLDRIEHLNKLKKENGFKFQIQVDGGVNDKTSLMLTKVGANNLVSGSYLLSKSNYQGAINSLLHTNL